MSQIITKETETLALILPEAGSKIHIVKGVSKKMDVALTACGRKIMSGGHISMMTEERIKTVFPGLEICSKCRYESGL